MRDFLVFQLWGPLCSWGGIAVGELRDSQGHPTKSAVLGLLAACLGWTREQEAELAALAGGLGLAVWRERAGRPLRDFHTVSAPRQKKGASWPTRREELAALDELDNPIVSRRDYFCDAAYLVCLWESGAGGPGLAELARALERPRFTPYLGRKACPAALPFCPRQVAAESIFSALENSGLPGPGWPGQAKPGPPQGGDLWWEPGGPPAGLPASAGGDRASHVFTRRDQPISRSRWQFAERLENHASL